MMERTDKNTVKRALPSRPDNAHKGTMGTLLSVCGSYGMAGAAILSSMAALRCGVGLLKCALPDCIYPIAAARILESVYLPLKETADGRISAGNIQRLLEQPADAVLIGCGISVCADTRAVVRSLLAQCEKPMVLDADALNCLANEPDLLETAAAPVIITPHPAEMARLIGRTAREVNANREQTALDFAERHNVIVVLKGAGTVIASPKGRLLLNTTGNSGMATGGSGDVLSGMCASLLAQGRAPFDCAAAAVYLHGLAGDIAAQRLGRVSMLPSDIVEAIPAAFAACGIK